MSQIILPMLVLLHIVPFELAPPAAAALLADAGDEIHVGGSRQEPTIEQVSGWVSETIYGRVGRRARAVDMRLRRARSEGKKCELVWVGRWQGWGESDRL